MLRFYGFLLILLTILLYPSGTAKSQTDSNAVVIRDLMSLSDFNGDNSQDTLISEGVLGKAELPKAIYWGNLTNRATYFNFPKWKDLEVITAVFNVNQDTLPDMTFFIIGKTLKTDGKYKDTMTSFIIFGQTALPLIDTIDIEKLRDYNITPYIAMKLTNNGSNFSNPTPVALGQATSYEFNGINLDVQNPPAPIAKPVLVEDESSANVKMYPNPAVYYTSLELNNINPGIYIIKIYDMNGTEIFSQKVESKASGTIFQTLDLKSIQTGTYQVKIMQDDKRIGVYPITIVH